VATSNSYDWTLTRAQVISGALRKLGVLASGASPSTAQTNDATEALNALVKAFHADGMPLWAITNHTFTVTSGTSSYAIGTGLTLNVTPPLKVLQARYKLSGGDFTPMNVYNQYDFNNLPDVNSEGVPINLYYKYGVTNGVDTGTIKLWPIPNDSTTQIDIVYQRPFMDMDATDNQFDFPSYWMQALIYNLAWALAPEYGTPPTDRDKIAAEAKYWKDQALSYGAEEGSIYFVPER
jgi:hypothetical protein